MNWSDWKGQCVVVEGYAVGAKIGPVLVNAQFRIGLVFDDGGDWPSEVAGGRVRVKGVVSERADLPVFHDVKGGPIQQGIPVPEGTNLEEARRRYVLEQVTTRRVRSPQQVEAGLSSRIGQTVTLTGVLWSLNGHWWFNHDGVDMHVDNLTQLPGWRADMHGQPVALRGKLSREMLPRIDQIALKRKRDLAEAYLLTQASVETHPEWPVEPCEGASEPSR